MVALPRRRSRRRTQHAILRAHAARRLARTRDLRFLLRVAHAHHGLEKRSPHRLRVRLRQLRVGRVVAVREHALLRRHAGAPRGHGTRAVLAVSRRLSGARGWRLVVLRRTRAQRQTRRRSAVFAHLARRLCVRERVGDRRMAARHGVHRLSVARKWLRAGRWAVCGIRADCRRVRRRLGARARRRADRAGRAAFAGCLPRLPSR